LAEKVEPKKVPSPLIQTQIPGELLDNANEVILEGAPKLGALNEFTRNRCPLLSSEVPRNLLQELAP
jgi:hypothetical protein